MSTCKLEVKLPSNALPIPFVIELPKPTSNSISGYEK
jgi:hypothetical protein